MSVFFWILIGLTWLGGVISMLTENFNASIKDVTSEWVFLNCFYFFHKRLFRQKVPLQKIKFTIPFEINKWKRNKSTKVKTTTKLYTSITPSNGMNGVKQSSTKLVLKVISPHIRPTAPNKYSV